MNGRPRDIGRLRARQRRVLRQSFVFGTMVLLIALAGCTKEKREGEADVRPSQAASTEDATERTAPLLDGMGDLHWKVTTDSELAQRYFDQGMTLSYGFNHLEAERSFREAARLDDGCAMCLWGAALVLGPNINDPVPTPERETKAYETVQQAAARTDGASD
ncbi:MAG: hypothetical protein AAF997_23380, partial [Myxococcota bacterium]